jgi:hypothetical protein
LIDLDFVLDPTLTIYEASRDLMRERKADWHDDYTLPRCGDFFRPSRKAHGSYWFDWTTADEIAWKENFRIWMRSFLNDYKNRGGRVTTGSDSGFIYKLYGFGYIREMELLQEAGFHPLEVIRSRHPPRRRASPWSTQSRGAKTLRRKTEVGAGSERGRASGSRSGADVGGPPSEVHHEAVQSVREPLRPSRAAEETLLGGGVAAPPEPPVALVEQFHRRPAVGRHEQ